MLRNSSDLDNFAIRATDGEIGKVKDMYFDDDAWVMRYFVVDTGSWLSSRKVLVSPMSVQQPDWKDKTLPVSITKAQVSKSPKVDTDKPVSRQHEEQYLDFYGYGNYWEGEGIWGESMYPYSTAPQHLRERPDWVERQREDEATLDAERIRQRSTNPHLRSCEAVVDYKVQATDGEIGHVAGFLVDEASWAIRYLIVDTSNWWMGHKVLVAPGWITGVHWSNKTVTADLSRDAIKASPPYDAKALLDRQWEDKLYQHYGRTGYWTRTEALQSQL
jgi:hypothetical protein